MNEPNYNSEFYEEVEDPLALFRKRYGGGVVGKKGSDPFAKDSDVVQSEREEKLRKEEYNNRQY